MQNRFIIVIPVYNSEKWIDGCLKSVTMQNYKNYDVIVVDDCSTDKTWDIINTYEVPAIRNNKHTGSALCGIVRGIKWLSEDKDDIIVTVDGDDRLASEGVLSYLNSIYTDVWMTYGSFLPVSGRYAGTCQDICYLAGGTITPQTYRRSGYWCTSHLRTFRRWLWDLIKDEDLRENGEYYKLAWDLAFMYPMIEMAGCHSLYVDKILYFYNDLNPNCDGTLSPVEQIATGQRIQNKEIYKTWNQ